jgi:hypothetical protein
MRQIINAYKIFVGNLKGGNLLEGLGRDQDRDQ